jgi:hypothetical protein
MISFADHLPRTGLAAAFLGVSEDVSFSKRRGVALRIASALASVSG